MADNRSAWWHWKRGALIFIAIGFVILATFALSTVLVGACFLAIELIVPHETGVALEDKYMMLCLIILTCALAPYVLSHSWEGVNSLAHSADDS